MDRLRWSVMIVGSLVTAAWASGPAQAQEKKYGGELFNPVAPLAAPLISAPEAVPAAESTTGPTTDSEGPTLSSPSALPPLRVKVLIPNERPAPGMVLDNATEGSRRYGEPSSSGRQYVLRDTSRDVIGAVLRAGEVSRMEVARPPSLGPINFPPIDGETRVRNLNARITHNVPQFLATFAGTTEQGATVKAAVFDEGAVRGTHVEFATNRVTVRTTQPLSEHSTHVAGTMAAKGVQEFVQGKALGMAKALSLLSFDWLDDLNQLDVIAETIQVSNHSYGPPAGWDFDVKRRAWFWWGDPTLSQVEDVQFGKYTADNQQLDAILARRPRLLTFVAAGNDRNDGPISQPVTHFAIGRNPTTGVLEWQRSRQRRNRDGFDRGGLDTIGGLGLSKNAICIGAIHDVLSSSDAIVTTDFSAWGPADDGRIKPDLVANGDTLLSTSRADDQAYIEESGTSMASPTAAGIGALLVENFQKAKNRAPISAEVKAVMIHTATDAGTPGPDPVFGWGSINALAAGRVIAGQNGATIRTDSVNNGQTKTFQFSQAPAGLPVRVTAVWTDPSAPANPGGLDDATPTLQNDLDAQLVAPDGTIFHPYSLVRSNPTAPATRAGPNRVDNVEVIDANPLQGNWQVKVKATNLRSGPSQSFALVVSGLQPSP